MIGQRSRLQQQHGRVHCDAGDVHHGQQSRRKHTPPPGWKVHPHHLGPQEAQGDRTAQSGCCSSCRERKAPVAATPGNPPWSFGCHLLLLQPSLIVQLSRCRGSGARHSSHRRLNPMYRRRSSNLVPSASAITHAAIRATVSTNAAAATALDFQPQQWQLFVAGRGLLHGLAHGLKPCFAMVMVSRPHLTGAAETAGGLAPEVSTPVYTTTAAAASDANAAAATDAAAVAAAAVVAESVSIPQRMSRGAAHPHRDMWWPRRTSSLCCCRVRRRLEAAC
mmetsp:Transcript_13677/g.41320  ORF Transcript_13677/g.41320 Transcript_13677/m.41320 type:complete len:278 (+) Transcript_13677:622-1455(+)